MTSLPRISIVVPSYNQGRFLAECLESIVAQDYPDLELIVMDGGSQDESVEVIRRYEPRIAHWQSAPDAGQSAAINAGMARATGDVVGWLNSDDLYADGSLWIVGNAWRAHPGRGLYLGNGYRLDDATGVRTRHNRRHMAFGRRALREGLDYIQQPSCFFGRAAWERVGGLDEALRYCMDWDVFIRIADRYPVVLVNEFLSVSREYADTKTAAGGLPRATELCRMIARHTGQELTVGNSIYVTETLLQPGIVDGMDQAFRDHVWQAQLVGRRGLAALGAAADGSPDVSGPGDVTYLPIPDPAAAPAYDAGVAWPRITVVTPSYNQAQYLERCLDSVLDQNYPNLEYIVMDGGSSDGSAAILERYAPRLAHWQTGRDAGPADAINKGFARSDGEVLVWLNSDDMFADGALHRIASAFIADPELEMIVGDALYVDADDVPKVMDHGEYRTAHYFGHIEPVGKMPAYWSYVHAIPQPATYFRRRLIERAGALDEGYKFIFDLELFFRFLFTAKVRKIDRVLAFYRIHEAAKTSGWSDFLVELYRFSRSWWPARGEAAFAKTRGEFLDAFMGRWWGGRPRGMAYRAHRAFFSWLATHRRGNPEKLLADRQKREERSAVGPAIRIAAAQVPPLVAGRDEQEERPRRLVRRPIRYSAIFAGYLLPRFPGRSGGEIRDFHLLRALVEFCRVGYVVNNPAGHDAHETELVAGELDAFHDPDTIARTTPEHIRDEALAAMSSRSWAFMDRLRVQGWPVLGPRLPRDVGVPAKLVRAKTVGLLRRMLVEEGPDFLFISPQTNPTALFLARQGVRTRFVFATYDVEYVRLTRLRRKMTGLKALAGHLEARRGERFERGYVQLFDGVIAVSELDKAIFVERYGIDPQRVVVIDNGVDTDYYAMTPRDRSGPPIVLYTASYGYPPNHLAALRLAGKIMPLLWRTHPDAQLWLVGQAPDAQILALGDGKRVFVTGAVQSVLPYIRRASVMCAPLELGSGTKTKVIEALSAGIPVVCSPIAAEGLDVVDGEHLVIRDTDAEIVTEIVRLLDDPAAADAMAAAGRRLAEASYSWDSVLPKLEPWLDALMRLPRVVPERARGAGAA